MSATYQTLIEELTEWFMQLFYDPEYYTVAVTGDTTVVISAGSKPLIEMEELKEIAIFFMVLEREMTNKVVSYSDKLVKIVQSHTGQALKSGQQKVIKYFGKLRQSWFDTIKHRKYHRVFLING